MMEDRDCSYTVDHHVHILFLTWGTNDVRTLALVTTQLIWMCRFVELVGMACTWHTKHLLVNTNSSLSREEKDISFQTHKIETSYQRAVTGNNSKQLLNSPVVT